MKYLKCESCEHYNLLNSEYQIFCNACGKKLSNNFKTWQKKHPTKNFEAYTNEVGTEKGKPKRNFKFSIKKTLQITVIIIAIGFGAFFGKKYSASAFAFFYEYAYPVSELLDKEWGRQFFMGNKVVIESPYWLEKQKEEIPLPAEVKKLIKEMNYYTYNNFAGFGTVLMTSVYDKAIGKINPKGAGDGAIQQTYQVMKGSDLFYNDETTQINNYPAVLKKGTFMSDGNEIHFKSIACVKNDLTLVYMITFWANNNKDYELLTDRIIGSLEIY
ncbi:hypothetical protein FHR24_000038 [Wenyingzhuangia heitensis]|uniref:Zinc ribbon domain-containing protein n=1 Tax=Wenyingzhuangia heitensis TaxID=1487859 RepID=A0ABX0U5G7_9FLAO|nr:hypothetical protein [Wenyingzhuangia heitensis]NIJ43599.1 hypothetical protein [Wenyingzhuangia heitensis]